MKLLYGLYFGLAIIGYALFGALAAMAKAAAVMNGAL